MSTPFPEPAPARSNDDLLDGLRGLRSRLEQGDPAAARTAAVLLGELDAALSDGAPPPAAWIVTTPGQQGTLPIQAGPDGTLELSVDVPRPDTDDSGESAPARSWGRSRAAASENITKVEQNADPEWVENARTALLRVACTKAELMSDDVWEELGGTAGTHEPRALGSIIRFGRRTGWLDSTGRQAISTRVVNHGRPAAVWASTLYVDPQDASVAHDRARQVAAAIHEFGRDVPEAITSARSWGLHHLVVEYLQFTGS